MNRVLRRALVASAVLLLVALAPAARAEMRFTETTPSCGIDWTMTSGKTPSREILEVNGGGVALFDYDSDRDLDLFFANGATMDQPEQGPGSRLYRNKGDGTFEDVTGSLGIRLRRWAMGVASGDYDGDGDEDLYVTCYGPNVLLRNDVSATGKFQDVTAEAGVGGDGRWSTSAAFADLDADSDLDLYVANYLAFDVKHPPPRGQMFKGVQVMSGPTGLKSQDDVLYENLGKGKFRDVTTSAGVVENTPGYGLGVVIFDADRDGKLDVFVGNDSTENFLFHNLGGMKFKDIGVVSGIASNYDGGNQATMGIALADVDGNGYADVFKTVFSSDAKSLHLNLEGKWFDDRASQYGLAMITRPFLSWGTGFYDFDSDGDEDLFIASGHVYPEAATHKIDSDYEQELLVFERVGARFSRRVDAGEMFGKRYSGRSVAFGDLDQDGDVDIVMTTLNGPVHLFRNDSPRRDVVVVAPRLATGGRRVPGAFVELELGGVRHRRWIGGGSYQSVDAGEAYFALGDTSTGEITLRVTWPGGKTTEHKAIPRNRRIELTPSSERFEALPLVGRAS